MQYATECDIFPERTLTKENDETTSRTLYRNNLQPVSDGPDYDRRYAWDVSSNGRHSKQEQFAKPFTDWTENNYYEHSSRVDSQFSYLPVDSVESTFTTTSVDQSGMYKHQLPRNVDSRQQVRSAPVGFEGRNNFPVSSTLDKEASELNRPFSHLSLASNGMFDPADFSADIDTTLRNSSMAFPCDRKVLGSDSLASTSLSVAFSGKGFSFCLIMCLS